MRQAKEIELKWTYPKEMNAAWDSDDSFGRGIYQITRWFGNKESLLYIGLVKRTGRHFYLRLNEHWWWMEGIRGTVYIRFGKIKCKQRTRVTEQMIETIEGALINSHKTKLNKSKCRHYKKHRELFIKNTGYRGFINKIVDTREHDC